MDYSFFLETKELTSTPDIDKILFIQEGYPRIFFHYPLYKRYGELYNVVQHFKLLIEEVVRVYGFFELHVNISSFTISACVKYKSVIESAFLTNTHITNLSSVFVYFTPTVIDHLTSFFSILFDLRKRIHYYKKGESAQILRDLL